ncbi:MAG: hypothetical protein FH753_03005 [Firmicutes bacterium]|nr:hypothetical protein [Bacillota bacterium]
MKINVLGKGELKKIPTLPLVLICDDGKIFETDKVKGAVSIFTGRDYIKIDNKDERWYKRLFAANNLVKKEKEEINIEIFDKRKGVIDNNFVIAPKESKYLLKSNTNSLKLRIDNDKLFLLSLLKMRTFSLLEREDSFIFKQQKKHKLNNKESLCVFENKDSSIRYIDIFLEYDIDKLLKIYDKGFKDVVGNE